MPPIISALETDAVHFVCSYAGMLKNHKQNLVPEAEFHNREERLKSQQTETESKSIAAKSQEKEGTTSEAVKEERAAKVAKPKATTDAKSAEAATALSKVKSEESKPPSSSSREQGGGESTSSKGSSQKEKEKAKDGGKAEAKGRSSMERERSESKERGSSEREKERGEKKATGKEGTEEQDGALTAGVTADHEQSISSTAKAAAVLTRPGKSPSAHNGPVEEGSSPARVGQRRQHAGDTDSSEERGEHLFSCTKGLSCREGTCKAPYIYCRQQHAAISGNRNKSQTSLGSSIWRASI